MTCERCKNFMVAEEIMLSAEESEQTAMSVLHCIYCGRIEYGTATNDMRPSGPHSFNT